MMVFADDVHRLHTYHQWEIELSKQKGESLPKLYTMIVWVKSPRFLIIAS